VGRRLGGKSCARPPRKLPEEEARELHGIQGVPLGRSRPKDGENHAPDNPYPGVLTADFLPAGEFAAVNITDLGSGEYRVSMTPTPEPTTMLLFGSGLIGLAGFRRRFKKS